MIKYIILPALLLIAACDSLSTPDPIYNGNTPDQSGGSSSGNSGPPYQEPQPEQ